MSDTTACDNSTKSEPTPDTAAGCNDNARFDSSVEDGGSNNVDTEEVTTSSAENVTEECEDFLPFQTLAVELKEEDVASPSTVLTNEEFGNGTNTLASSEDTVLSNDGFTPGHFEHVAVTVSESNDDDDLVEQTVTSNGTDQGEESLGRTTEVGGMPPEMDDDAAVDFDTSMYLQQQMVETPTTSQNDNVKTSLEDFLLSSAPSSSMTPDSDSASNDEKGLPLHRFPKIVKAMESADYSILQVLYRLLYLRNAWDTESILTQRILDFSGFDCDPNSEDFYTREVMLRTVSCDVLLSIGKLLCIENLITTTDFDKLKIEIVSKVMNFLYRPKRKSRSRSRPGGVKRSNVSQNRPRSGGKSYPGTKSSPKTSGLSNEKLAELEKILKSKMEEGIATEPKVDLTRLDPKVIEMFTKRCSTQKMQEGDEDSDYAKREQKQVKSVCRRMQLSEFPHVVSSIEGTPDELLGEVHNLLFLMKVEVSEMKKNVLDFSGFSFDEDSDEYKKRVDYLNKMDEDVVKDVARALYLDPKIDKNGTIMHLLSFLGHPNEECLRPTVVAPGMLSDCDVDIEGMSDFDSDDSITCEIVPKRVECIDLISSGEESDSGKPRIKIETIIKQEPVEKPSSQVLQPTPSAGTGEKRAKRTLRDFETITKIVNTHPTEYLVDIYNLLYMVPYEPMTLRKDILDFSGFEFEKGTPEYIKRKQFLDRMLYNSVRRIYNTLIHNTREVKVFSKPTMIGEIFQFLFKLPDTDTSIRPPPPKPSLVGFNLNILKDANPSVNLNLANKSMSLPSQSGKLSDLKRVFQRVACFPCEYLVDVHKLLFMTDCDMKDIRANIFGFKGFSFGVDSPDFNQRKLYLEYLTFHSLRKISSVLTTKTVDLRNSTKHELASHLTEVLKEYTNTYVETQPVGAPEGNTNPITATNPVSTESAVEQIVVTPIIPPLIRSSSESPEPQVTVASSFSADDNMTVSSSTSAPGTQSSSCSSKPNKFFKSKEKEEVAKVTSIPTSSTETNANSQFPDIHLPEVEKYRRIYQSNIKIMPKSVTSLQPQSQPTVSAIECPPPMDMGNAPANAAFGFRPEFVLQQVTSPYAPHLIPQGVPFIQTFPQPIHIQSPYVLPQPAMQSILKKDDESRPNLQIEGNKDDSELPPQAKRIKLLSDNSHGSVDGVRIVDSHSLADRKEEFNSTSSSLHLKIRDAMTKASEDEEDCDKPLSMLLGHPNDKVLKQQICEIVENTDLQEITINGVIQKIFSMYPKFNLNYRKEFIKSALRSLLYRLGEQEISKNAPATTSISAKVASDSPDCSVSTTDPRDSPEPLETPPLETDKWKKDAASPSFQQKHKS